MRKEERVFIIIIFFMFAMSIISIISIYKERTFEICLIASAMIISTMNLIRIYKRAKEYEEIKTVKK